jgi:hypothetical protein
MLATRRTLLRTLERMERAHAEERRHLLDVICHLSGKPWTPPPANERPPEQPDPDNGRYIALPEQLP